MILYVSNTETSWKFDFTAITTEVFDCTTLLHLPSVENLLVDCINEAANLDIIKTLENLKTLSLGVHEMKDPDFLDAPNFKNLTELRLGDTRHETIDLLPIAPIHKKLKYLHLTGQSKHIEYLAKLTKLEKISLGQMKKSVKLDFVNSISTLKFLRLILGGRSGVSEVKHENLEKIGDYQGAGFLKI